MTPYTTLKRLKEGNACSDRYSYLSNHLGSEYGDDTRLSLAKICKINGIQDALWVPMDIVSGENLEQKYRLFAVSCCQDILHLMNPKSREAVKIAHLHAHGEATDNELAAAWAAAWGDAAWDAAWDAARAAARAVAEDAAGAAAGDAAWDAATKRQAEHFSRIFSE